MPQEKISKALSDSIKAIVFWFAGVTTLLAYFEITGKDVIDPSLYIKKDIDVIKEYLRKEHKMTPVATNSVIEKKLDAVSSYLLDEHGLTTVGNDYLANNVAIFRKPRYQINSNTSERIDVFFYGHPTESTANKFCQTKLNGASSLGFKWEHDIGRTVMNTSGLICNDPVCDGFDFIICDRPNKSTGE